MTTELTGKEELVEYWGMVPYERWPEDAKQVKREKIGPYVTRVDFTESVWEKNYLTKSEDLAVKLYIAGKYLPKQYESEYENAGGCWP